MVDKMEARRLPEHLAKELVWGFVKSTKEPMAELTTTPSTTDWVSESPGVGSGQFWGRVWGIGDRPTTASDNVVTAVSPTIDLVKDLVTEHIEKVKVTMWETTNIVTDQIEEVTTLSKEQIVAATSADETSFSTTTTTTISTTTLTTRGVEVTKDYRVLPGEVGVCIEDLHWSYYLLIGRLVTAPHQPFDFDQQHYDDGVDNGDDDNDIFQLVHDDPDDDTAFMMMREE